MSNFTTIPKRAFRELGSEARKMIYAMSFREAFDLINERFVEDFLKDPGQYNAGRIFLLRQLAKRRAVRKKSKKGQKQ